MNDVQSGSTSPSAPLLEAIDIHKTYSLGKRKLQVLRGVSLMIGRGDFIALRGASGAGKSTLLHLLGGIDLPNSGSINFAGQNLRKFSNAALAHWRNQRVGFIFQAYYLFPELSALENVCLAARMLRMPMDEAQRRGRELLQRVGLAERINHRPYELSGGEQQRVAIARALVNNPELILADEPTGNLDSQTGEQIVSLLMDLRHERQTTLVIATHDLQLASRAPRVIELVDGQIKGTADVS